MPYDFDHVIDRAGTMSEKCDPALFQATFPAAPKDCLPMWVADMDFPTAPCVQDAITSRAAHPIYGYTNPGPAFHQQILWWLKDRRGFSAKEEHLSFFSGIVSALSLAILAFTKPGEQVVIQEPVYYPFRRSILLAGRVPLNNALSNSDEKGHYNIDFIDLEKKLQDPKTTLMLFCSPHNPVGRVWTEEEVRKVATLCAENNVVFLSDEIHGDLILGDHHFYSAGSLDEPLRNSVVLFNSASKSFNIAGLSFAYGVTFSPSLKEKLDQQIHLIHFIPHTFGIAGTSGAYTKEGADWLDQLCIYLTQNMNYIADYCKENLPDVHFVPSAGTYLAWLDCRAYCSDGNALESAFLQSKILMDPGQLFGEMGNGFTRLNVASPLSTVKEAMKRIQTALYRFR